MRSGLNIGRIFGINIRIDWSWLFIFFLISWNLVSMFGQLHPGWGLSLRIGVAVGAAILFFSSVLAHELAHSLMARAQNVNVRSITMHLFGGVSNIERHPPSPLAEFLITIVGPITSIVLGVIIIMLTGMRVSIGTAITNPKEIIAGLDPLTTLLLWLGPINIILGLFNLIPGFPLDGGRVLRSILWGILDDLRKATRWASGVGQGIAWLMIIAGIAMAFGFQVPFFGSGLINGLWLAFIGWFLNTASAQSYRQIVIQDILEGVPVGQMMRSDAPTVPPDCIVNDLVHEYVMGTDDHAFPVIEDNRLLGMVTLEDVRSVPKDRWETTPVREIMTTTQDLVVVQYNEDASEALNKLSQRDVRQLPVIHDEKLVGLLRRRDIIRWLQVQSDMSLR
jgi:Zn-dependent protease